MCLIKEMKSKVGIRIYMILVWVRAVARLATSGYHYGTFLDKYVHSIDGTNSHSFFTIQILSTIRVPYLYPLFKVLTIRR